MPANVQNLFRITEEPFNVIEEFAALSPKRKVVLCDHLSSDRFGNTVRLLWPEASSYDIKKLEKFLRVLKKTVH